MSAEQAGNFGAEEFDLEFLFEIVSGQGALFIPGDDFDPVDGTALFVGTAEEKQHGERQQQRQPDGAGRGE